MTAQVCVQRWLPAYTVLIYDENTRCSSYVYFVHDEINMIPCTVGNLFSRIRYVLKSLKFKTLKILKDFKDIYSASKLYDQLVWLFITPQKFSQNILFLT